MSPSADPSTAVLLSGGIDSTALALWRRPAAGVFVDYGQRPAAGELRAATAVAQALAIPLEVIRFDASSIGSGLLAGQPPAEVAPSSEWWPFRNQLLATVVASWAIGREFDQLAFGTVASDGFHQDGTPGFFARLDALTAAQEGGLRVTAPAIELSSVELIHAAQADAGLLGWTHSCHRAALACGQCPGCAKRSAVLAEAGIE